MKTVTSQPWISTGIGVIRFLNAKLIKEWAGFELYVMVLEPNEVWRNLVSYTDM